eukprot:TRINITY_DN36280_c0_g1_i1.p1 TRINITY_DN36280_c0_g1~~TRINITY_DN36280_c0_g1_i1.p1  ORF type:complete len:263 (+),score=68.50 TRINITY_DN36280_c0_g1_i1:51-839(+)
MAGRVAVLRTHVPQSEAAAGRALSDQRVCMVTHVDHFIGFECARSISAANPGWHVVLHAEDVGRVPALDGMPNCSACGGSPTDALQSTIARHGRLDVAVSCDFFPAHRRPAASATAKDMRDALEAMTVQPYEFACRAAQEMGRRGWGRIVFVTSAAPLRGLPNYSPYCTARGATNALAKTLAVELAPRGVTVNAVAPNFVRSESYFPRALLADPQKHAKIVSNIPVKRLGTQQEAASAVAYLVSEDAGFVTGQVMSMSGGWA